MHIGGVQIQANENALAAILGDGSVVTWGDAAKGGDSSAVQDQLKNVQSIQATGYAFAAIVEGGSVVTWGVSAVTVVVCRISWRMFNRSKPPATLSLPYFTTDLS